MFTYKPISPVRFLDLMTENLKMSLKVFSPPTAPAWRHKDIGTIVLDWNIGTFNKSLARFAKMGSALYQFNLIYWSLSLATVIIIIVLFGFFHVFTIIWIYWVWFLNYFTEAQPVNYLLTIWTNETTILTFIVGLPIF